MSDEPRDLPPPARVRSAEGSAPYVPHEQFRGSGIMRSCGKCGKHRMNGGGRKVKPWGWVAACCVGAL